MTEEAPRSEPMDTDFMVDFMVTSDEARNLKTRKLEVDTKAPHWEDAGVPVWDRKDVNIDDPEWMTVDHNKKEKRES